MYIAVLNKIFESGSKLIFLRLSSPCKFINKKSNHEKQITIENRHHHYYRNPLREAELSRLYRGYSIDEANEIFLFKQVKLVDINGITFVRDTCSKYYNVVNHHRCTTDTPEKFSKTIYFFGNCWALGIFSEDKMTIESQLQRKLNSEIPFTWRVLNYSNWKHEDTMLRGMLEYSDCFKKDDLIIVISHSDSDLEGFQNAINQFNNKDFFTFFDISNIFQRPHKYGEIFFDVDHAQHGGYSIVANFIFEAIKEIDKNKEDNAALPKELGYYLFFLKKLLPKKMEIDSQKSVVGAIAMNCNPFTRGHEFLVMESLKRCDFLYVFILDEDRSFFSFDERFSIAKRCLKDFDNVAVVPSGKMIISSVTLPEYFEKDEIQNLTIDTSYDINIFCQYIAPYLKITKRFAGDEPLCNITRQYNQQMREILPRYDIEFVEIPRLRIDNEFVSASLVRKCIENKNFEKIKELVPDETYNYLCEYLFQNN